MDFADIGSETAEHCIADAIARQMGKSAPEHDPDFDGLHCLDCMDTIPAGRLAFGRIRCVECQEWLDKEKKMAAYNRRVE